MLYDRKTGEKKNLTENFDRLGGYVSLGRQIRKRSTLRSENEGRSSIDLRSERRQSNPMVVRCYAGGRYDDLNFDSSG